MDWKSIRPNPRRVETSSPTVHQLIAIIILLFHPTHPGDINHQASETSDIERSIRIMQNDMLKLNTLLHKERGVEHDLQQGNVLVESAFVGSLKEAELESIQMQDQLDGVKEEKERLLNSLVESE